MHKLYEKHIKNNIVYMVFLSISIFCLFTQIYPLDNDGWYIMAHGRSILKDWDNLYHNALFILPDYDVLIQQWAYCVLLYKIYDVFGVVGTYLFIVIEICCFLAACYKLAKLKGADIKTSMLIAIMGASLLQYLNNRPELITLVLCAWQIYCFESYKQKGGLRQLLPCPFLIFLEANLHASMVILHFIFVLPYIFPPIKNPVFVFKERQYKIKPIAIIIVTMFLISLINPYHYHIYEYIINVFPKQSSFGVTELYPAFVADAIPNLIGLIILGMLAFKKRAIDAEYVYLELGTFILAIMTVRNICINVLVLTMLAIILLSTAGIQNLQKLESIYHYNKDQATGMICLAVICLSLAASTAYAYKRCSDDILDTEMNPVSAIEYLDKHASKNSRIYTLFNNGGYYAFYGYKIFMMSSGDVCFKEINHKSDYFKEVLELSTGATDIDEFIDKYQFDYIHVNKETSIINYMYMKTRPDFKEVVSTEEYALFEKQPAGKK